MATEKLRAELELITRKAEADLERFDRKLSKVDKKVRDLGGKGGAALRPLGTGLSTATANADEFGKSMAAANARVIAFGASAGLVLQISRALKETVKATREVEKALIDINIVLNANTANLQRFGDSLFKIAGQTGQSFQVVATAATELARQGLSMEKTLLRTKDALILTRLTGMGAEEAVSSLTAAVNSFNKSGITSAQVINKMARVDQAFAVSSDDLAKAISRVGSSAVDAGVSMDQLLAITTAVQQRTARGGAVIGNAFKTIFTRIGRVDVQKKLASIGVATRDMQGAMLPATKVLENLADKFKDLSQVQQNSIAESVAGVFQVNILRATLGDLSSKYGIYTRALKESSAATDEAYRKNEQLNETLDALINRTLANLTKMGAGIGGAALKPAIENVLNLVNSAIGAFGEGGKFEEFGKGLGKDILQGIGKFLSGPGLVILTVGIGKLAVNFASFAKTAMAGILELNKGVLARKGLEDQVTAALMKQPDIIRQIQNGEISAGAAAKDMLATMRAQNMQADKLRITTAAIAGQMLGMGAGGSRFAGRGGGRAGGFVPNFANAGGERAEAAMGGYRAGGIKSMSIPGQGSVMYNGAETVKRFPGMVQPAIMPPKKSFAGVNYKSAFGAAHGFDPYAGSGFVPNFRRIDFTKTGGTKATAGMTLEEAHNAGISRQRLVKGFDKAAVDAKYGKKSEGGKPVTQSMAKKLGSFGFQFNAKRLGVLGLDGKHSGTTATALGNITKFKEFRGKDGPLKATTLKSMAMFTGIQTRNINDINKARGGQFKQKFRNKISEVMTDPMAKLTEMIYGGPKGALGDDFRGKKEDIKSLWKGNKQLLPPGAEGSIFEAAVQLGLITNRKKNAETFDQSITGSQKPFDFEETGRAKPPFKQAFGFEPYLDFADAKRTVSDSNVRSIINKAYNKGLDKRWKGLPTPQEMKSLEMEATGRRLLASDKVPRGKASGFIPNFTRFGAFGKGNVGSLGSAKAVSSILGLNMKPSMIRKMLSKQNAERILSKKDAFMGSRTGQAMTKMLKSFLDGTARGLPLSVWIAESIGLYGKTLVANAMKMVGNLTKGQKIGTGIAFGEGFVPNYSPLGDALGRERAAGVPSSAIRIGSSPSLMSGANPGGLGVYNTFDEPAGLGQGISRAKGMGVDPKSHGASRGLIPNFRYGDVMPVTPVGTPSKMSWIEAKKAEIASTSRPSPVETKPPTKPLGDAPEKIEKGATKFAAAVDRLMMPMLMLGYMATPAIERKYGAQAGNQFQGILGGAFAGQMALSMTSGGMKSLGTWGAAQKDIMGGLMGTRHDVGPGGTRWDTSKFSKKQKWLNKIIGTSKSAPAWTKVGKVVPKVGKVLPWATMGLASAAAYMGLTDSPEDMEYRLKMARLGGRQDKLKGLGGGTDILTGNISTIAQNYATMTNPQVVKAYEDLNKQTDKLLEEAMLSGEDIDTKGVESAMNEFGNEMIKDSGGIESAQERASKALKELTDRINELGEAAESEKRVAELKKLFEKSGDVQESFRDKEEFGGNVQDDETVKELFLKHMGKYMARNEDGTITKGNRYGGWLFNRAAGFTEDAYSDDRGTLGGIKKWMSRARHTAGDVAFGQGGVGSFFSPTQWITDAGDALQSGFGIRDQSQVMERMVKEEFGNFDVSVMSRDFVNDYMFFMGEAISDNLSEEQKEYVKAIKGKIGFTAARKEFIHEAFDDLVEQSYMGPKGKPVQAVADLIQEAADRDVTGGAGYNANAPARTTLDEWRGVSPSLWGVSVGRAADQPDYVQMTEDQAILGLKQRAIHDRLTNIANKIQDEKDPTKQLEMMLETDYFKKNENELKAAIAQTKLPKGDKKRLGATEVSEIVNRFFAGLQSAVILKLNLPEKLGKFKRVQEDLVPFALQQINLQDQAMRGKRDLIDLKRQNKQDEALAKVKDDLLLATAKATMSAEEVADVDLGITLEKTKRTFENLEQELRKEYKTQKTAAQSAMAGILLKSKKDPDKSVKAEAYRDRLRAILEGRGTKSAPWETTLNQWGSGGEFYRTDSTFSKEELLNRELATVRAKGVKYGDPDDMLSIEIKMIEQAKKMLEIDKAREAALDQHNKGLIDANQLTRELDRLKREQLALEFEYNRSAAQRNLRIKAAQAKGQAKWSAADLAAGKITGGTWAQIQRGKRQAKRDAFGLDPAMGGAPMASIGTIFKEEWTYGQRSQTEEFEDGMADVARTVKSSLKTAIKDIVSGAESFEDGMFRVFAALADKLADQGISMGVNSLFGMFGGSKGGMVPRGYDKGGMVRGGSGVRDDVLTYMQGGEYVIRKSAVNRIPGGEATLNAINGGNARGGLIPSYPTGGKANVSLAKEFLFNDPKRPTSGGYNISRALSTSALFREDDPQTANTIGKQAKFVQYQAYRQREQERRDKIIESIERQKKGRLYNAYLSAALRVGAGALGGAGGQAAGAAAAAPRDVDPNTGYIRGSTRIERGWAGGGHVPGFASGGPARVMGGEYIMSAGATAEHGTAFMSQLNRGRLPGFQEGGLVGGGAAMVAGITTNNVNLSINIDKSGGAEVTAEKSGRDRSKNDERSTSEEAEDSKKLAEGIRNAVLKEIITQQRPGGLLRDGASASGLRSGR